MAPSQQCRDLADDNRAGVHHCNYIYMKDDNDRSNTENKSNRRGQIRKERTRLKPREA